MWLSALATKAQAASAIREFQQRVAGESGYKLKVLRMDRGGEFNSKQFTEYCAADGVQRQLTATYSPQQNGVIEWRNKEYAEGKGITRMVLGGEVVALAVYLLNRVPCKAIEGKMSFKVWYGRKPAVHHLKVFGSIVYVRNVKLNLKKLEDRGRKMIFVGYEHGSKAYRAYDLLTGRVTITRDVVFDKSTQWDWSGGEEGSSDNSGGYDTFTVQYLVPHSEGDGGESKLGSPGAGFYTPTPESPVLPPEGPSEEDLDANHNDAPL
jgi:hypothetical protein